MRLLRYLGKQKIVRIDGQRTEEVYDPVVGTHYLYPQGTERVVEKFYLFPTEVGGVKVRGTHQVRQYCKHDIAASWGETVHFERWCDKEVLAAV